MSYATKDQVKTFIGWNNTAHDSVITEFITWGRAYIDSYTQRKFDINTYTEMGFFGSGIFALEHLPIVAISELHYNPDEPVFDAETLITDYTIKDSQVFMPNYDGFYKVIYTAGFTVIPSEIQQINIEYAVMNIRQSKAVFPALELGMRTVSKSTTGALNENISYMDMYADWQKRLDKYRKITI
jgi:hypothetical protein